MIIIDNNVVIKTLCFTFNIPIPDVVLGFIPVVERPVFRFVVDWSSRGSWSMSTENVYTLPVSGKVGIVLDDSSGQLCFIRSVLSENNI